jgi:hypothetical protein
MPKADVLSALPNVNSLRQLITAKARWRVSLAAFNYRVHKIGITSDWRNRDFCIAIVKNRYNTDEPEPIAREKSMVWEKVLKVLWSESTTHLDIAEQLALPVSEVSDLLFGVLITADEMKEGPRQPLAIVLNDGGDSHQASA